MRLDGGDEYEDERKMGMKMNDACKKCKCKKKEHENEKRRMIFQYADPIDRLIDCLIN